MSGYDHFFRFGVAINMVGGVVALAGVPGFGLGLAVAGFCIVVGSEMARITTDHETKKDRHQ